MNNQKKHLILLSICLILFLLVGFFLINNFRNIQLDGVSCMSNPLGYAENRLKNESTENYICECRIKSEFYIPDLGNRLT